MLQLTFCTKYAKESPCQIVRGFIFLRLPPPLPSLQGNLVIGGLYWCSPGLWETLWLKDFTDVPLASEEALWLEDFADVPLAYMETLWLENFTDVTLASEQTLWL